MPKLKLKAKKGRLKLRLKTEIPKSERDDAFPFLIFYRNNEQISRVDRYSIKMYWDDFDAAGNPAHMEQLLFYPSEFGMEEIDSFKNENNLFNDKNASAFLIHRLDQLKKYGNPWWRHNTDSVLNEDNWLLAEPEVIVLKTPPPKKNIKSKKKLKLKDKTNEKKKKIKLKSKKTKK